MNDMQDGSIDGKGNAYEEVDIPIIDVTPEKFRDETSNYIIRCTYPSKRTNHTFRTENYIRCNNHLFIVKWFPAKSQASIICSRCNEELTSFNLNMSPTVGGVTDGHDNNIDSNNDNSGNITGRNDIVGDNDSKKID